MIKIIKLKKNHPKPKFFQIKMRCMDACMHPLHSGFAAVYIVNNPIIGTYVNYDIDK